METGQHTYHDQGLRQGITERRQRVTEHPRRIAKCCLLAISAAVCVSLGSAAAQANDTAATQTGGFYVGALAGVGAARSTDMQQRGAVHLLLGKLPIDAKGPTESSTRTHLGGLQLGYEFDSWQHRPQWHITPTAELEAVYMGKHSPTGEMPVHPAFLGMQYVTVPTQIGLAMLNAGLIFKTPYSEKVLPMLGIGAGAAFVSITGADSANPSEPGINHFNSDPDASDTALALQFKAGVKIRMSTRLDLLAEYRYLTIDATHYRFGETDYPGEHQPTDSWRLDMDRQQFNFFAAGFHYRF